MATVESSREPAESRAQPVDETAGGEISQLEISADTSRGAEDGGSQSELPPEAEASTSQSTAAATAQAGVWQAIWSPQHNAYYFYNTVTQETTWLNPLQTASNVPDTADVPSAAASSSSSPQPEQPSSSMSRYAALQAAAAAQGIDPSLAHLDPSLASSSTAPSNFTYSAKFNARTGAFSKPDARDPTHLSEYERAKRMSEFYFDVAAWEKDVAERKAAEEEEAESKKRKRPTKKDLERFKEQKKQKKIAKTAWLRT